MNWSTAVQDGLRDRGKQKEAQRAFLAPAGSNAVIHGVSTASLPESAAVIDLVTFKPVNTGT